MTMTMATCLIADELRSVALDAVDRLKDVGVMFRPQSVPHRRDAVDRLKDVDVTLRAESVPRRADDTVDAAPSHPVSDHIDKTSRLRMRWTKWRCRDMWR